MTLDEAHEELAKAVEALRTGDDWQAMLDTAAKFHSYSANNIMLIVAQRPDASAVAGYGDWQKKHGRQVQKGEKAIKILAPLKYKAKDEDGEEVMRVRGFRLVNVFDVSQTEGEPLKVIKPEPLEGDGVAGLVDRVIDLIQERGYTVQREAMTHAYGYTNPMMRVVAVRDDLSEAQVAKTLIHELAHVILHAEQLIALPGRTAEMRMVGEVEAESVAYLVCRMVGLDSGSYSFPYVARWSDGDMDVITGAAKVAVDTARLIVSELEVGA